MWAVAAGVDTLRLITVIEAAAGFGLMPAAITYVLSIYPLTHSSVTRPVRCRPKPTNQRFPFLYYFRAREPSATLHTFIRGTAMVCLQARWCISTDAAHTPVCRGANCSFVFSTPSTITPSAS